MKMKMGCKKYICTLIFIATLFTLGKIRKQFTYPPINEWIKDVVCVCV